MHFSRRQTLALVLILALTATGLAILVWRQATRGTVTITASVQEETQTASEVIVHVCGAVGSPGVYRLPTGARVYEAIDKAGGALSEADQEALNLAAPLVDGEQIYLPRRGEAPPPSARQPSTKSSADAPIPATASAAKPATKLPLHLNQASAAELEAVPGIGPVLAASIVAYRQTNGPFALVEDLLNVSGIGEKTLAKLRPYLLVP